MPGIDTIAKNYYKGNALLYDGEKADGHYLDVGDNVYANVCEWLYENCGQSASRWFIPGECENGHRVAKIIACGKEWCPVCNKLNSIAHNRRFVRWLVKIMQFRRMRYFVFTIPENVRCRYRDKKALATLGRQAQDILKSFGYKRGLRRWHWFGDCVPGKKPVYHPHLNCLVEGGYIKREKLAAIKSAWAGILGVEVVSVNVQYKRRHADMAGCLSYVTRATFLDYEWDMDMALELRGFRNMVVWGRDWDNQPSWELDDSQRQAAGGESLDIEAIEKLVNHICPRCGSHITWSKALPGQLLDCVEKVSYGAGYHGIKYRPPPAHLPGDVRTKLKWLAMVHKVELMQAAEAKQKAELEYQNIFWRNILN